MYHGCFIHSPVKGHLGCFQFGAFVDKFLCEQMFLVLLGQYLGVGLLDCQEKYQEPQIWR